MAEQEPQVLELEPGTLSNVGVARRFVRSALDGVVSDSVSSDLQLATSELVTNALEHGARQPVRITVRTDQRRASVTIASHALTSAAIAEVEDWAVADPSQRAGRGLGIVRAIADEIEYERSGSSLTITVHRELSTVT